MSSPAADLLRVLAKARERGLLGPGDLEPHLELSGALAQAIEVPPSLALDLGAGGGVPGLVLARCWPETAWTFLDARQRSTEFLSWAIRALGLVDRVRICRGRAEDLAHDPGERGRYRLVVARGFGPPATTAECAAGFLDVGGSLLVTEPPERDHGRWPAEGLALLGLRVRSYDPGRGAWVRLEQRNPCPVRFPRRVGLPKKRPLF